ncbi:ComEC family competence protein [Mucilaginibacter sp. Bleaf8]|uniref:ComEC/Rec2 family competence protein n=1 Tax=Mucilaginibacter sp. Bleaf8 TaxID=2834430 RepID=UPI001BCBC61A|nr:ComEC/Rec2 family competence protein [Mucilaginibacter sp. Bleaf8]MBS7563072.1 ComEC family competence protein [Mucilaginibacter sp. Bleaf8]
MHFIRKSEIPALILLLPFIAGIVLGLYFHNEGVASFLTYGFICSATVSISLYFLYNKLKIYRFPTLGGWLLHVTLALAGWLCLVQNIQINRANHFSKQKADYLLVKVSSEPKQSKQFFRYTAEVIKCIDRHKAKPVSGKLLLTIVADSNSRPADYGDLLLIPANYKAVDPPFNPAEFNYKQYLAHQNIYQQSFIVSKQAVIVRHNQGNAIVAYALHLRQQMVTVFKTCLSDTQAAAVASTLILGYKADLSPDVLAAYSKTGTIHVLSVSGAHVAIIFWFISLLLAPVKRQAYGKWFGTTLSILLIWGYALLTGFSPAVCRAALMISFVIIGKAANSQAHTLNILSISAFILLLYNPLLLTDVGFQLSYLAVFGLVVIHPLLIKQIQTDNKWLTKLWFWCSASIAAQLITFPLSTYYFHQFPLYFLISNLFIIIPSEFIMACGISLLMLYKVPYIGVALGWLLQHAILLMNKGLIYLEHLPAASIGKLWLTPIEHGLLYLLLGLVVASFVGKRQWKLLGAFTLISILCISFAFKVIVKRSGNEMVFLNLKKHTGIVFKNGAEAVVITDLTATEKHYQYSVQPGLDSLQVDTTRVLGLRENLSTAFVRKQRNLVQFRNKRLLIVDKHIDEVKLNHKLQVNYLFVTGSPHTNLAFLSKNFRFDTLIIDANNSRQRIDSLTKQADAKGIKYFTLKRNKALTVVSN